MQLRKWDLNLTLGSSWYDYNIKIRCKCHSTLFFMLIVKNNLLQIAVILDAVDTLDVEAVVTYVKRLQQADGSFVGDVWGEVDTR